MPGPCACRGMTKPAIILAVTAFVVVLAVAGNLKKSGSTPDTPSAQAPPMPGFVNHQGSGFSLQRPEDWQVTAPSLSEISVTNPNQTSAALVRARVVRGDLARYLAENYLATEAGMRNSLVLDTASEGPNVARAMLAFRQGNRQKRASVVAVRQGEVATVFAAIAPTEEFGAELPTLTQILESFRFTPPEAGRAGGAQRAPTMQFVQGVDPGACRG